LIEGASTRSTRVLQVTKKNENIIKKPQTCLLAKHKEARKTRGKAPMPNSCKTGTPTTLKTRNKTQDITDTTSSRRQKKTIYRDIRATPNDTETIVDTYIE
jgi:hypothetical protein